MAFSTGTLKTINWLNVLLPIVTIVGIAIGGAVWWVHDTETARQVAEEYAERQMIQRMVLAKMDTLRADQLPKYIEGMGKVGVDVRAMAAEAKSAAAAAAPAPTAAPANH